MVVFLRRHRCVACLQRHKRSIGSALQASSDRRRSLLQGHFHFHPQQPFCEKRSRQTTESRRSCSETHNSEKQPLWLGGWVQANQHALLPLLHLEHTSNGQRSPPRPRVWTGGCTEALVGRTVCPVVLIVVQRLTLRVLHACHQCTTPQNHESGVARRRTALSFRRPYGVASKRQCKGQRLHRSIVALCSVMARAPVQQETLLWGLNMHSTPDSCVSRANAQPDLASAVRAQLFELCDAATPCHRER